MNAEEFHTLCVRHDLTYMYSDDGSVYRMGSENERRIREAAKLLPDGEAARIWNNVVDSKLVEAVRDQFYWR